MGCPSGALSGPVLAGEGLVDDRDLRLALDLVLRERAALDERYAHGPEVVGAHSHGVDRSGLVLRLVVAADADALHVDVGGERQPRGDGHGAHSRHAPGAPRPRACGTPARGLVVAVHLEVERRARRAARGRSRARFPARAGRPARRAAPPRPAAPARARAGATTSASRSVTRRRSGPSPVASALSAGTSASEDAGPGAGAGRTARSWRATRAPRTPAPSPSEPQVERHRHGRRVGAEAGEQRGSPTNASSTPRRAAERREREALAQQLAHEPRAAGADGGAHRELARPRGAAREQHVGHVRARDHEHEPDRGEQHRARRLHVAVEHRVEADARRGQHAGLASCRWWPGSPWRGERRASPPAACASFDAAARGEPPLHEEPAVAALLEARGAGVVVGRGLHAREAEALDHRRRAPRSRAAAPGRLP